jgi:FAD:protein FMN transferase
MWFQKDKEKRWDDAYELVLNFEIQDPGQGRYMRPYVAVWVEDKSGFSVRTLTLWFQQGGRGMRWLRDLRQWFRLEQMRKMAEGGDLTTTASSPTRQPGKYSMVWNGRDDKGKPVAQGDYTICLEVAREHGTYQVQKKQVTLRSKGIKAEMGGNVEVKTASVEFRKKK